MTVLLGLLASCMLAAAVQCACDGGTLRIATSNTSCDALDTSVCTNGCGATSSSAACMQCVSGGCNTMVWPTGCTANNVATCGTGVKPNYVNGMVNAHLAGGFDQEYICWHESMRLCAYVPLSVKANNECYHCSNTHSGVTVSAGVDLGTKDALTVALWFAPGGPLASSQSLKPYFERYRGRVLDCAVQALCQCPMRSLTSSEAMALFGNVVTSTLASLETAFDAWNPTVSFANEKKCIRTVLADFAFHYGVAGFPKTLKYAALRDKDNYMQLLFQELKDPSNWGGSASARLDENGRVLENCLASERSDSGACVPNVVFVVDASGSVGSTNFALAKTTINEIAEGISDNAKLALIRFDSFTNVISSFAQYTTKAAFKQLVTSMSYPGGGTQTDLAINSAVSQLATVQGDAARVIIILTDGQSNSFSLTSIAAQRAVDAGIICFSVGIGSGAYYTELLVLAGNKAANVFLSTSYAQLAQLDATLSGVACTSSTSLTPGPNGEKKTTSTGSLALGATRYFTMTILIWSIHSAPVVEITFLLNIGSLLVAISFSGESATAFNSVFGVLGRSTGEKAVLTVPSTARFSMFSLSNGTRVNSTTLDFSVTGWSAGNNSATFDAQECTHDCVEGLFSVATPSATPSASANESLSLTHSKSLSASSTGSLTPSERLSASSTGSLTPSEAVSNSSSGTISPTSTLPLLICNVSLNASAPPLAALEDSVHGTVNCSSMVPGVVYHLTIAYTTATGAIQRTLPYGTFTGTSLSVAFSFLAPFVLSNSSSVNISVICTLIHSGETVAATADGLVSVTLPDADRAAGLLLNQSEADTGAVIESVHLLAGISSRVNNTTVVLDGINQRCANFTGGAIASALGVEKQLLLSAVSAFLVGLPFMEPPAGFTFMLQLFANASSSLTSTVSAIAFEAVALIDTRQREMVGTGSLLTSEAASFVDRIGELLPIGTSQSLSSGNFSATVGRFLPDLLSGTHLTIGSSGCSVSIPAAFNFAGSGISSVTLSVLSYAAGNETQPLELTIHMYESSSGDLNTDTLPAPLNFAIPSDAAYQTCVFFDTVLGNWSTEGVTFIGRVGGTSVCATTHLTSFTTVYTPATNTATSDADVTEIAILVVFTIFGTVVVTVGVLFLRGRCGKVREPAPRHSSPGAPPTHRKQYLPDEPQVSKLDEEI